MPHILRILTVVTIKIRNRVSAIVTKIFLKNRIRIETMKKKKPRNFGIKP